MKRLLFFTFGFLLLSHLAGAEDVAETTRTPAGDDNQFIAPQVDAEDSLFEKPDAANGPWNDLEPKKVIMLPQNITTPSKLKVGVNDIDVRIVHNGAWLAVAISWEDAEQNYITASDRFSDAIAIGFPKKGPVETSPFMGGHEAGVEIDYWKALWQHDIDEGYQEVTDLHPNTVADEYIGYRSEHLPDSNPASSATMKEVMSTPEGREGLPAVAIGNPMSQIDRKTPVEQNIAEGFGSLTTQKHQDARGHGRYSDGRWTVVITRPMDTGDEADVQFKAGLETAINFAVWDGGQGDVSGRKNYSMFTPLLIAEKE